MGNLTDSSQMANADSDETLSGEKERHEDQIQATTLLEMQHQIQLLQQKVAELEQRQTATRIHTSHPSNEKPKEAATKDATDAPSSSRIQYVISKLDRKGGIRIEEDGVPPTLRNVEEKSNIAFIAKEIWIDHGTLKDNAKIILKSPDLRTILQDVLGKHFHHDKTRNWAATEKTLQQRFTLQLLYWAELQEAIKSTTLGTEQGREDLRLFLEHIRYLEPDNVALMESISTKTRISSKDVWALFRPGELVITRSSFDDPQVLQVHSQTVGKDVALVVVCWAFDWTGTELTRKYYEIPIKLIEEEEDINNLGCYPIRYYKGEDSVSSEEARLALFEKLITRGRKFRELCLKSKSGKLSKYDGRLVFTSGGASNKVRMLGDFEILSNRGGRREELSKKTIKEYIMIDCTAFEQYSPSSSDLGHLKRLSLDICNCTLCLDEQRHCREWIQQFDMENESETQGLSRSTEKIMHNYLLLPPRVLGYCLNSKIWGQFHVDAITDIDPPNSDDFDKKLIFPDNSDDVKTDLKTLIAQHGSTQGHIVADPVAGKGAGLVILLHGPPGVGKTLTAETLATASGKPLYVVGASDIGSKPESAEENLRRIFELSEKWGAVLLIDEADVFLDSRGSKGEADAEKNALVSVMLRELEYFKGILIMTTNRVLTFDVAMLSRCHYAINFGSLSHTQEKEIWKGYLSQLDHRNSHHKKNIEDWVKTITKKRTKLNGRDIRNVFTTAQTLAQAEADQKVRKEHLERIYDRLVDFIEGMEKTVNQQQPYLNVQKS